MTNLVNKKSCYLILNLIMMVNLVGCVDPVQQGNNRAGSVDSLVLWEVGADMSIDSVEFKRQYQLNPGRWGKAFNFLRENDLEKLEIGRYEIDGDNLFVNIDEYDTKPAEEIHYEAHQVYADIQYLVSGVEKIAITSLENLDIVTPYNKEKDIVFYSKNGGDDYRMADSTRFFIFFPNDAHKPCVEVDSSTHVRKVVVKVKL